MLLKSNFIKWKKTKNQKKNNSCPKKKRTTGSMDKAAKEDYFDKLAHGVRQADEFRLKTPNAEKARKILDDYIGNNVFFFFCINFYIYCGEEV